MKSGRHPVTDIKIRAFYDQEVERKIRDFVFGNTRVDRAWETLERYAPAGPKQILEIGCGMGANVWRMSKRWPLASITGLDISPESLKVARRLFDGSSVAFVQGPFCKGLFDKKFDYIVMMDVYEHIGGSERATLHEALREALTLQGRLFLSIPTPRHLGWLKDNMPSEIQPIDEDIQMDTLIELSEAINQEILLYKDIDVWRQGDYAHVVLGSKKWLEKIPPIHVISSGYRKKQKFVENAFLKIRLLLSIKSYKEREQRRRIRLVEKQLGNEIDLWRDK